MDMGRHEHSTSSASSSSTENKAASWSSSPPAPNKRPAGRTKFRETRHPVFRGVRRWVCEVRVPGKRGARLWLGTYVTAETAACAHDAAMLLLRGRASACLNFADSAWLLAVPPPSALFDLADVRRTATEAVAKFLRRFETAAVAVDEVTSSVSDPSLPEMSGSCSPATSAYHVPVIVKADDEPAALDGDMFEPEWFGDMDLDTYYASLAQALLMEPAAWEHGTAMTAELTSRSEATS